MVENDFRILMTFIIIVAVTGAAVGIWVGSVVMNLNKEHNSSETITGDGLARALIIVQPSSTSTTEDISHTMADILSEKGYKVTINYPSSKLSYNLEEYDVIAFGSAVYFGKVSSVLKKYATENNIENKKIILFASGISPEIRMELELMSTWVNKNNRIDAIKFNSNNREYIHKFIDSCIENWNLRKDPYLDYHDINSYEPDAVSGATM
jgi:hypothetical protein